MLRPHRDGKAKSKKKAERQRNELHAPTTQNHHLVNLALLSVVLLGILKQKVQVGCQGVQVVVAIVLKKQHHHYR